MKLHSIWSLWPLLSFVFCFLAFLNSFRMKFSPTLLSELSSMESGSASIPKDLQQASQPMSSSLPNHTGSLQCLFQSQGLLKDCSLGTSTSIPAYISQTRFLEHHDYPVPSRWECLTSFCILLADALAFAKPQSNLWSCTCICNYPPTYYPWMIFQNIPNVLSSSQSFLSPDHPRMVES